jgi:hypothetical protein
MYICSGHLSPNGGALWERLITVFESCVIVSYPRTVAEELLSETHRPPPRPPASLPSRVTLTVG